jgi:hypothetical protein
VSTDHATRYRQDRATATRATATRTAVGSTAAGATVVSAAAVCGRGTRVGLAGLALRGLSLALGRNPSGGCAPKVLGRDLGGSLTTCFIRGFQLLLSSVAACGVCGAADLIGRLRQEFVTLGRLLLNYRRTKLAVSGRLSGCRCLASTEGG